MLQWNQITLVRHWHDPLRLNCSYVEGVWMSQFERCIYYREVCKKTTLTSINSSTSLVFRLSWPVFSILHGVYFSIIVCFMTSSNGNIFCVTRHLCGEFTGDRWNPRQWRGALMFHLIWINGWVNRGDAGDLRRHRAHYDVISFPSYAFCGI